MSGVVFVQSESFLQLWLRSGGRLNFIQSERDSLAVSLGNLCIEPRKS